MAFVDFLVNLRLDSRSLNPKRLTVRRSCEPESLGWYLVHWGLDRGLSEEVGSEVEVTNTVVVGTLIELEVDKVRSYFWSVR